MAGSGSSRPLWKAFHKGRDLSLTGAVHGQSRALGGEEPTAATSQKLLPNSE